jgi:hypothetical protein
MEKKFCIQTEMLQLRKMSGKGKIVSLDYYVIMLMCLVK